MQDQAPDVNDDRLYIAVRADLPAGLQAAQAAHAAFQFFHEYPVIAGRWFVTSNYLIIVSVPDENALAALAVHASILTTLTATVREPDINDEITAVALAPTPAARRLCSQLPLALRDHAVA